MRELLTGLIDDAALFPPRSAGLDEALTGHRQAKAGPYAWLTGAFLVPASRVTGGDLGGSPALGGLAYLLEPEDMIHIGLVVDTGVGGVAPAVEAVGADPRLRLAMIEIPLPADADQARAAAVALAALTGLPAGTACYLELPRVPGWREALDGIAAAGRGAKLRTGGLRAELFPTPVELAAFLIACVERGVPFKCTAGLHRAVRHVDPDTAFAHHGFLNIALATCRLVAGPPGATRAGEIIELLEATDGPALAALARETPAEVARRARGFFASYGSCDLAEPVHDLDRLSLI